MRRTAGISDKRCFRVFIIVLTSHPYTHQPNQPSVCTCSQDRPSSSPITRRAHSDIRREAARRRQPRRQILCREAARDRRRQSRRRVIDGDPPRQVTLDPLPPRRTRRRPRRPWSAASPPGVVFRCRRSRAPTSRVAHRPPASRGRHNRLVEVHLNASHPPWGGPYVGELKAQSSSIQPLTIYTAWTFI